MKLKEIRNYILLNAGIQQYTDSERKEYLIKKRIIIIENFGKKLSVNFQPLFEKLKKKTGSKSKNHIFGKRKRNKNRVFMEMHEACMGFGIRRVYFFGGCVKCFFVCVDTFR